jgi:hypothetical protein
MELPQPTGTIRGPITVADHLTSPLRATHFATHGEAMVVLNKMRRIARLKANCALWARAIAVVVMGVSLAVCVNNSSPVSEAAYSTKIVGRWQGTVGDLKETMSINEDGTFSCEVRPMGFIANMLYPVAPGTVSGTWSITGKIITLTITGAKNERLANKIASSTIMAFNENELVLRSAGTSSSFRRVLAL